VVGCGGGWCGVEVGLALEGGGGGVGVTGWVGVFGWMGYCYA